MRRSNLVALLMLLAGVALPAAASTPRYYVNIDQRWYAVTSGEVVIAHSMGLVDVPQLELPMCSRANGGMPASGQISILMGTWTFNIVESNERIRTFHSTSTPVVRVRTPTGDVSCGPGVVPPPGLVAEVERVASGIFHNSFD